MVVPPPPSDWSFPKAEVISPLDWGFSQDMSWVSSNTQGLGVVRSLSHQTWSSPSPAFISFLVFYTGIVAGPQPQPLLVGPSI